MPQKTNKERYARERKEQLDKRREEILSAAQNLFLRNGLENVTMKEIADKANISKMTLYRYFPNRDPIAFEIAIRMLNEIFESMNAKKSHNDENSEMCRAYKKVVANFREHESAFRFLGMFDHLYKETYPNEVLSEKYKKAIFSGKYLSTVIKKGNEESKAFNIMMGNLTFSFLEKMAARGKLLELEQGVSVDEQLNAFTKALDLIYDKEF